MKKSNVNPKIIALLLCAFLTVNFQAQQVAKEDTNMVKTLNVLASKLISDSKLDSAILYANSALQLAKKLNYKSGIGFSYIRLGMAYDGKGSPEALVNYQSALKIKEQIGEELGIAWTNYHIGNFYSTRQNCIEALKYIINAKKLMIKLNDKNGEIACYNSIGACYSEQGKYKEALENYNITLNKSKQINDSYNISLMHINIGDVYLKQGNYKKCLKYQDSALKISQEVSDKNNIALCYINIGICNKNLNNLDTAEKFGVNGFNLSREINEIELIIEAQKSLSEIYTDKGDIKKAFEYYKGYIATRDSLINEKNTKKTTELEMNFQFEKKEAITKLEQDKRDSVQRSILSAVIFGLMIALTLAVMVYRNYKRKQKDNVLLTEQKEELNEKNRIIEHKQSEILASIRYAKRIQVSLLPTEMYIEKSLNRLMN